MKRKVEIIQSDSTEGIPSIDRISRLSRNKTMKVMFGKNILSEREAVGNKWGNLFPDFQVEIHTENPEINIVRLIGDDEIVSNQDFFEQYAKDYRNIATRLIYELARHLDININPERPLESFNLLKNREQQTEKDVIDSWIYYVHGFHCCFENIKTAQLIEVSLINGLEFGAIDPYFFTRFIKSTPEYNPLPIEIYDNYAEGARIIRKMVELGKFEKIKGRNHIVVTDRENIIVK